MLLERARQLKLPLELIDVATVTPAQHQPGSLQFLHISLSERAIAGELNCANARYVLTTLQCAVTACQTGAMHGMVTAPVHKGVINDAGIHFSGHTEYLAGYTKFCGNDAGGR